MSRPHLPTPKIIHLSMDFFPPATTGRHAPHCLEGFLAHIPAGTDAHGVPCPQPAPPSLRCFFSETTSHSMITVKASRKLPKCFAWGGRTVVIESPFVYRDEQQYWFTSALGDALEEDRDKKRACTPQLVAHGLIDVHFMVGNGEGGCHYFHMPDVVLVTEFFGPGAEPSIVTPAEKKRMEEEKKKKKIVDEEGKGEDMKEGAKEGEGEGKGKEKEADQGPEKREQDPEREGFELCLGQDFFQMYPHLMFSIVATPALELRISSIHFGQSATQLTYEGEALSICAVGTCVGRDSGGRLTLENGFAVHFAPQSVYNSYHHLPSLRQKTGAKEAPKKDDLKFVAPTLVRACLASLILALELATSLSRLHLPRKPNGIVIYHNTDYFDKKKSAERARCLAAGTSYPNMDLIHRLTQLQSMVEDRKRGNLGKVRFVRGEEKQLEAAMKLATLGACMMPFTAGPGSFEESRMASGTEHPINIGEWGIDPDSGPSRLDPEKYFVSVEKPKEDPQDDSPLAVAVSAAGAPGGTVGGPSRGPATLERSADDGALMSIPESMVVKRSPMFLNFGNTSTYVVRGKPIAYTERQLFMMDRDLDVVAALSSEMEEVL